LFSWNFDIDLSGMSKLIIFSDCSSSFLAGWFWSRTREWANTANVLSANFLNLIELVILFVKIHLGTNTRRFIDDICHILIIVLVHIAISFSAQHIWIVSFLAGCTVWRGWDIFFIWLLLYSKNGKEFVENSLNNSNAFFALQIDFLTHAFEIEWLGGEWDIFSTIMYTHRE